MCGFIGFAEFKQTQNIDYLKTVIAKMNNRLIHRGPDNGGIWVDGDAGIAIGHRRLSIIDPSPEGHQPMVSACGRYVIAFNGEIYNHLAIRKKLEDEGNNFTWRGHSDTEVMLAAFSHWGICTALKSFIGMFAFVLWDRKKRVLHLGRDRLGEKPLYYGWMGDTFLFGSELKALEAHPKWHGEINRDVLALFIRHGYIPESYSIYKRIYKIPPGNIISIGSDEIGINGVLPNSSPLSPTSYWSAQNVAEYGVTKPFACNESDAIQHLDFLLRDAIRQQMVADVPLGAFLSGGIDSSTVVALMQAQSSQPVRTFTIGFDEPSYNEATHAKAVARHLGTDHTELYVTPEDALAVIPKLPTLYDEPFADSSQIPTYLVSKMTRQHVTVSLSGDGGDELFGGYNRYFFVPKIWKKFGWIPPLGRQAIAWTLKAVPDKLLNSCFGCLTPSINKYGRNGEVSDKLRKLAGVLELNSPEMLYLNMFSAWKQPSSLVLEASEPLTVFTDKRLWANLSDFTEKMFFFDQVSYLPGDILVKLDRAAMGVSLETRLPFLDHRVLEFAWQVPLHMKIRDGQGKWLLRQVLYKYIPKNLFDRPKRGFAIPIDVWLRGSLRDWAEELLNEKRLREEGFFNPTLIREKWSEHLSGKFRWQDSLWSVLMFQAWLEAKK